MAKPKIVTTEELIFLIGKHKALSIKQINIFFSRNKKSSLDIRMTKLFKDKGIQKLTLRFGIYYFLTNTGAKIINKKVKAILNVNERHTTKEIELIRYITKDKEYSNGMELLKSYKTEREIKNEKGRALGAHASKYRYVDLLFTDKDKSPVAYEIEITKKAKGRYKEIIQKLDKQAKEDKGEKIIWIVPRQDKTWYTKVITSNKPTTPTTIRITDVITKGIYGE